MGNARLVAPRVGDVTGRSPGVLETPEYLQFAT